MTTDGPLWVAHEINDGDILSFVAAASNSDLAVKAVCAHVAADARRMGLTDGEPPDYTVVEHGEEGFEITFEHEAWEWHYSLVPVEVLT